MIEFDQNLNPVEPPQPHNSFTPPTQPTNFPKLPMTSPNGKGLGLILGIVGIVVVASVLFITLGARPSSSTGQMEGLSVNADSTAYAVPDIAKVTIGATKNDKTVALVESQLADISGKIKTALITAGIKETDIKTVDYNIYPQQTYSANSVSRIVGYTGHYSVEVVIRDLNNTDQILSVATATGANEVGQLNFTLENTDTVLAQARKEALKKAKDKAKQMATDGGFRLGKLISVNEYSNTNTRTPIYDGMGGSEVKATPTTEPGNLSMQVNVTLVYQIR